MNVAHKTIVITGASSGVGRDLAQILASKGAKVILLARREEKLDELKRQIEIEGGSTVYYVLDIADADAVSIIFAKIIHRFHHIDVLINCAGIGQFEQFSAMDSDMIDRILDVNVRGLMHCTQAVLPSMIEAKYGYIVNIASLAGIVTTPKSVVYGASKHAVIGFSQGLRLELASQGIRVLVVNPGPIRSPFLTHADPSGTYILRAGRYMLTPRKAAEKIVRALQRGKREIRLPWYMGAGAKLYQIMPAVYEKLFAFLFKLK